MYSVKKSKEILELIQELYQQKLITKEDKNCIADSIRKSFTSKSYMETKILWKTIEKKNTNTDKQYMFDDFYNILGGN
jgi:hypothetical protein